jgi:hypothetical protein
MSIVFGPGGPLLMALGAFGAHLASRSAEGDSGPFFSDLFNDFESSFGTPQGARTHIPQNCSLTFQHLFVTAIRDTFLRNSKPNVSKMIQKL